MGTLQVVTVSERLVFRLRDSLGALALALTFTADDLAMKWEKG